MPYEEFAGWQEYFRRRPPGWRDDNRAAIISMSMAGSDVKPEDLFDSLRVIKQQSAQTSISDQFVSRFGHMFKDGDMSILENLGV